MKQLKCSTVLFRDHEQSNGIQIAEVKRPRWERNLRLAIFPAICCAGYLAYVAISWSVK